MKIIFTWDITPCNLEDQYPEGGGAWFFRNIDGVTSPKAVILKANATKIYLKILFFTKHS